MQTPNIANDYIALKRVAEAAKDWPNSNISDYLFMLACSWQSDAEEREKYRTAGGVLCGAHIGVPQDGCPVCRADALEQRDETETMNIGATLFAVTLRDDNGAGEFSPGPCADVLTEWRQMRAEINDLRASGSLLANQMRCKCGGQLSKLLACLECGDRYELVNQDVQSRRMSKLHVFEVASQNAPPFAAASFQAVSDLVDRAERAEAALEQARALAEKWRNYANDPIPLVHRRMADELDAALLSPAAPGGAA